MVYDETEIREHLFKDLTISHLYQLPDGSWNIQTNADHSEGVADRCRQFASEFDMGPWGEAMGLLHDKGKEQKSFQQHIVRDSGLDPSVSVCGDFQHAYVGALLAEKRYSQLASLIENALMGHHRGLYDDCDMQKYMHSRMPQDVNQAMNLPQLSIPKLSFRRTDIHMLERMLFSCLVDADSLNTEAFMDADNAKLRGSHTPTSRLLDILEDRLMRIKQTSPDTEVNRVRNYVQEQCRKVSDGDRGFYSLTVPTGGGKTLSSLLWALRHAVKYNLRRVIIAIPYTSIIAQTAAILRDIFGAENVLEHHSNIEVAEDEAISDDKRRLQLATENWDYPIVVTTNVQLFESLFSNKRSACRKLHNIVNSVIILDEAQMLPMEFMQPIIDALDTLKRIFGCSVLFTTASQPVLCGEHRGMNPGVKFQGLQAIHEIIPPDKRLYDKLRRVNLEIDDTPGTYDELADRIAQYDKVLCIVNTRKDASELYKRIPHDGVCIHLSRMMCPAHVREAIGCIKAALIDPDIKIVRVISTQLIEAGVDIDFPVVFRQEAGLDSVLQAAGRCNREGKQKFGKAFVFSLQAEHPLPSGFISNANNARKNLGKQKDWFAPSAMTAYFEQLFSRSDTFDKGNIADSLYKGNPDFEDAAKHFKLIDDEGSVRVIVNWGESMEYVAKLKQYGPTYSLMKKLDQYSVSLHRGDFDKLRASGSVEEVMEGIYYIPFRECYDDNVGLSVDNQWIEEILIK